MSKKRVISALLVCILLFSNVKSTYALTTGENAGIQGNSLLVGDYLFELDGHGNSFNLDSFMSAIRSIDADETNAVYYKKSDGSWYELVNDSAMSSEVAISDISNDVKVKNGASVNTDPAKLTASNLTFTPSKILESTVNQGTFETEVMVTIDKDNNAGFAPNIDGDIDAVASASMVRTAPTGTSVSIQRIDDKNITFKVTGTASNHMKSINEAEGQQENQKDYNKNGIFGDMKFLMLPEFFTGTTEIEDGGQYVVVDLIYNDAEPTEDKIFDEGKSKRVTVENVDYGVLVLNEGVVDDYSFTLNDATIHPTKVNDSGTVVKFEMNRKQVAVVKATHKTESNKNDSITIGDGTEAFTGVIENQDPDRILVSGPVSYFDYYLVDYDEDGNVRTTLEKTTFNTENEGVTPIDPTVPSLTLAKERTPLGEDVLIHVDNPTETTSKQWLANVYEVLKDYDTSESTRVPVQFKVDKENSSVSILANSTAIDDRNGHHEIVIKSNGFNDVHIDFELVEPAGDIYLSPNFNWWAENELLFELQEFNYAILNPIYAVYLDGEKLQGDCEDYHVVSNLVRLENNVIPKLTVGEHTLTIKAHGFEDYTKTFTLETAPNGASNPTYGLPDDSAEEDQQAALEVDAVSAATGAIGGGPTGGSGSGSGGGGAIRANVIYDFDHLSNAFILTAIDMNTPYVEKLINWWHSFTKDAIIKDGSEVIVDYQYYKNKVGINGDYDTFAELHATMPLENPEPSEYMDPGYVKPAGLYLNRPYNVKNMLHDAVMGDIYAFGEVTAKEAPQLMLTGEQALYGADLVINYAGSMGDEWADALVNVKINSNYLKFELNKDSDTITFKAMDNSFATGDNELVFTSEGYMTKTLKVNISKQNPTNIEATMDNQGNIVIGTFTEEFMNSLGSVYLDGKGLFTDSQVGGDSGSYHIVGNQIILRAKIFGDSDGLYANDQQHTVKINASGYNSFIMTITPDELNGGSVEPANVPDFVALDSENAYRTSVGVSVVVAKSMDDDYKEAITGVKVNGSLIDSSKYSYSFDNLVLDGSIFNSEKDYDIVILATDYEEKKFTITVSNDAQEVPNYVTFAKDGETVVKGTELIINFDDGNYGTSDYAEALNSVQVGSHIQSVTTPVDVYDITSKVSLGNNVITLMANGYQDKVFTVNVSEGVAEAKLILNDDISDKTSVTIGKPQDIKVSLGNHTDDTYKDAVVEIKVDNLAIGQEQYSIAEEGVSFSTHNVLTVKETNFAYGNTYLIAVEAEGYNTVSFTIAIEDESVGMDVPGDVQLLKNGQIIDGNVLTLPSQPTEVKLVIVDGYSESAYETALEGINGAIIVNGSSISTDEDTVVSETVDGSYKRTATIDVSAITEANYDIVLKADGYKDKTFTVTVDPNAKEDVPSIVGLVESYSSAVSLLEVETGDDVSVKIDDSYTPDAYKNAITGITIEHNGSSTDKERSELSIGSYSTDFTIDSSWLNLGENKVTVRAEGYRDYIGTVKVIEANYPNSVGIFDGDDDILSTQSITYAVSQDVTIVLGDYSSSSEKAYIDSISAVKVNGNPISDYTTNDTFGSWNDERGYTLPASYFTPDSSTAITLESIGYQDASFIVTILAVGAKLPVPNEVGHVNSYGSTYNDRLFVTSDYKDAITKVTFDGQPIETIPYSFSGDYINFSTLYSSNGGSYSTGTYTIVIEANGYEDYTGSITF